MGKEWSLVHGLKIRENKEKGESSCDGFLSLILIPFA
jgi:hypothetical protein